jgi:hypothetical protein
MPVELVILAFVIIIALCMVNPRHYFLVTFAGLIALALFQKTQRSGFADGDEEQMKYGKTLDVDGRYGDLNVVSSDLDSSADIDALLNRQNHDFTATDGDELLSTAMRNVQEKSKEAILNRARCTSDNARKYFQEELDAAEQQHWWEDDSLVRDTIKDGYHHESDDWVEEYAPGEDFAEHE